MAGFTRDGMDYLTEEAYSVITADLERRTWAGSTWAFSWCALLGLTSEAESLERDLRRTGSIDAGHRKDLVDALQAKRQPTPAIQGGVQLALNGASLEQGEGRRGGFRR